MKIDAKHVRTALLTLLLVVGVLAITWGFQSYRQKVVLDEWWDRMNIAESKVQTLEKQQHDMQDTIGKLIEQRDEPDNAH